MCFTDWAVRLVANTNLLFLSNVQRYNGFTESDGSSQLSQMRTAPTYTKSSGSAEVRSISVGTDENADNDDNVRD